MIFAFIIYIEFCLALWNYVRKCPGASREETSGSPGTSTFSRAIYDLF